MRLSVCHGSLLRSYIAVLLGFGLLNATLAAETKPVVHDWPAADPAALAHWQSLRFGMFIHWGPVSLTGKEIGWSRGATNGTPIEVYDNLYKQFNPTNFNANQWVSIAKAAGMKYIVLTTKHHDGFCLWDTKLTDHNIMHTPFHRDVVKELADACKKQGIEFGAYYSTCDWYNTNWPATSPGGTVMRETSDMDAYEKYLRGQITELINNYGPLITIWNDVPKRNGVDFGRRGADTIKMVRQLQPDLLINNRTGDGGDYDTPEQKIGKFQMDRPWESCMTVSAHNHWAWGGANDGVKSTAACLDMLIHCAGGDGNMLLNVGPRPDGVIDPEQANRLKHIGDWLAKNGESIYGTRGGPWKPSNEIASTRKGSVVYVQVLKAEGDVIELPALPHNIESASVLGGGPIKTETGDGRIILHLPEKRDALATVIKLNLDGSAMDIPAITVPTIREGRVKQLQDLRWGMFVCWSFSTFSGREWTTQSHGPEFFKATGCDTDQWAKTAKAAGMGYILFLAKHHDGFCLWDTKTTNLKVTQSPLGIDVLARLRKSCEKNGIKLALYFSEGDWNFPGAVRDGKGMHGGSNPQIKKAQLKELLTQYGPIEYIWFDHAQGDGGLSHSETVQWVKSFQPDCFVGFNHGEAAGDIRLGERGRPGPVNQKTGIGNDTGTAIFSGYRLAEFTYPILPEHQGGANWFYSLPEHDHLCLPAEKIYADYQGALKFGNIFSLDVGPDYAGKLRDIDVQTLRAVGEMIRTRAATNLPAKTP